MNQLWWLASAKRFSWQAKRYHCIQSRYMLFCQLFVIILFQIKNHLSQARFWCQRVQSIKLARHCVKWLFFERAGSSKSAESSMGGSIFSSKNDCSWKSSRNGWQARPSWQLSFFTYNEVINRLRWLGIAHQFEKSKDVREFGRHFYSKQNIFKLCLNE